MKRQSPGVVVLPETLAELRAVVALCHEHGVPLVPRGAGTGLSGGALPLASGVLLVMSKFNRVLEIDAENRLARVEPGVTNLSISEAVRDLGLYYAPDPSSQVACTIGGNVAENSGGVHCLKYGLTVNNVRQLKVVSPEGEIYMVGSDALDNPGFDLLALLHGSEGLLGIVVEITVALLPKAESTRVVMAGFDAVEAAANCVADIIASNILPAGLEMMDQPSIRAAEAFVSAGYPTEAAALLLCELDGTAGDVEAMLTRLTACLERNQATKIEIAVDAGHRERLWQGRKATFPAVGRLSPDYYCMDGTIPRRHLAAVLGRIAELSREYGLGVANVFHAGDGNLHPLILYDGSEPEQVARAEAFGADILELSIEVGGTITGEHGVGVEKIDQMCLQFTPETLSVFHGIKTAFDAEGILNPGKAVPTLNRCAEFGAMHVHRGEDRFPHLERF